ncbi:hypothetical protein GQ44DRAFT_771319 [Phaeosphaeriaceae sp. PMI808]|nr:hypothetical protein GQ44DRAFT_771319 [Phaeosphaeriaceae sp. PMI808]
MNSDSKNPLARSVAAKRPSKAPRESNGSDITEQELMPIPHENILPVNVSSQVLGNRSLGLSTSVAQNNSAPVAGLKQRREDHKLDEVLRFLIVCSPGPEGNRMMHLRFPSSIERPTDQALIQSIKEKYHSLRPFWARLKSLQSFSEIRVARFTLRRRGTIDVVAATSWEWPRERDLGWVSINDQHGPDAITTLSVLMRHIWIAKCEPQPTVATGPKGDDTFLTWLNFCTKGKSYQLPITENSKLPYPWLRWLERITVYIPEVKTQNGNKDRVANEQTTGLDWSSASLELVYNENAINQYYIYQETPKKLHTPLVPDPHGPRFGWAIWIEEDFWVPWYIPFVLTVLSIGTCVFAALYTDKETPKADGWTIGSCLLAAVSLGFNAFIWKTKDSRHAKI